MSYSAGDIIVWTGKKHQKITLDQLASGPSRYFYRVMGFSAKGQKPLVYKYRYERVWNENSNRRFASDGVFEHDNDSDEHSEKQAAHPRRIRRRGRSNQV